MKKAALVVLAVMVLGLAQVAMAQTAITNPATATTQIQAIKGESLSIVASSLTPFVLESGATISSGANATQTLSITTNWNLKPSRTQVDVCAGASDLTPAVGNGNTESILASAVKTGAGSTLNAGAGCTQSFVTIVATHAIDAATRKTAAAGVTDTVDLKLAGVPADLQADTYSGTISVYAYVQ